MLRLGNIRPRATKAEFYESIIKRGFLLTINANGLDSFQYFVHDKPEAMDVMQKARVCFTEIPAHLLHTHNYGRFGFGFQRKTIIEWGAARYGIFQTTRARLLSKRWARR